MSQFVERMISSPVGGLLLVATGEALVSSEFAGKGRGAAGGRRVAHSILDLAEREFDEYFQGRRQIFTTPLAPEGTEFQRLVWNALTEIPYGVVCSYRDLAKKVGRPKAMRAVGAANGRNPLPIIIPCHRVIGAGGELTGYGGGLDKKRWLLRHERTVHEASSWTLTP